MRAYETTFIGNKSVRRPDELCCNFVLWLLNKNSDLMFIGELLFKSLHDTKLHHGGCYKTLTA